MRMNPECIGKSIAIAFIACVYLCNVRTRSRCICSLAVFASWSVICLRMFLDILAMWSQHNMSHEFPKDEAWETVAPCQYIPEWFWSLELGLKPRLPECSSGFSLTGSIWNSPLYARVSGDSLQTANDLKRPKKVKGDIKRPRNPTA